MGKKIVNNPLALHLLAALTPEHYAIQTIDEEIKSMPGNLKPDIIGITSLTASIKRTFALPNILMPGEPK